MGISKKCKEYPRCTGFQLWLPVLNRRPHTSGDGKNPWEGKCVRPLPAAGRSSVTGNHRGWKDVARHTFLNGVALQEPLFLQASPRGRRGKTGTLLWYFGRKQAGAVERPVQGYCFDRGGCLALAPRQGRHPGTHGWIRPASWSVGFFQDADHLWCFPSQGQGDLDGAQLPHIA